MNNNRIDNKRTILHNGYYIKNEVYAMNKILYLLVISLLCFNSAQAIENSKNDQQVKVEYWRVSYDLTKPQLAELISETLGKGYSVNLNNETSIFRVKSDIELKQLEHSFLKPSIKNSVLSWLGICSFNQITCGGSMVMANSDRLAISSEKVSAQLKYLDNKTLLIINSYKTTGDKSSHNIKTFKYPAINLDINYKYYLVVMSSDQQNSQNSSITLVKIEPFTK